MMLQFIGILLIVIAALGIGFVLGAAWCASKHETNKAGGFFTTGGDDDLEAFQEAINKHPPTHKEFNRRPY